MSFRSCAIPGKGAEGRSSVRGVKERSKSEKGGFWHKDCKGGFNEKFLPTVRFDFSLND